MNEQIFNDRSTLRSLSCRSNGLRSFCRVLFRPVPTPEILLLRILLPCVAVFNLEQMKINTCEKDEVYVANSGVALREIDEGRWSHRKYQKTLTTPFACQLEVLLASLASRLRSLERQMKS